MEMILLWHFIFEKMTNTRWFVAENTVEIDSAEHCLWYKTGSRGNLTPKKIHTLQCEKV